MNIAIDYDDTYSADPELWQMFIVRAHSRGHNCYIVTCRRDTEENRQEVYGDADEPSTGLHWGRHLFTGLSAKRWFCEQRGLKIDVWIDDDPACIENGK